MTDQELEALFDAAELAEAEQRYPAALEIYDRLSQLTAPPAGEPPSPLHVAALVHGAEAADAVSDGRLYESLVLSLARVCDPDTPHCVEPVALMALELCERWTHERRWREVVELAQQVAVDYGPRNPPEARRIRVVANFYVGQALASLGDDDAARPWFEEVVAQFATPDGQVLFRSGSSDLRAMRGIAHVAIAEHHHRVGDLDAYAAQLEGLLEWYGALADPELQSIVGWARRQQVALRRERRGWWARRKTRDAEEPPAVGS